MSSSVSSERAFSQGGITVSKRRNRLKGDVVEALQLIKCAIRHDLLFREPAPSLIIELEEPDLEEASGKPGEGSDVSWDELLDDEEGEELIHDSD